MPTLGWKDAFLSVAEAPKKPNAFESAARGAGGFARGAGTALVEAIKSLPQQLTDFYEQASGAPPTAEPGSALRAAQEQASGGGIREAARTIGAYTPLPVPGIGPVFPAMALGGLQAASQAGAPVAGPTGPMPPPPETVGERLGGAAVGMGMGLPGLVGRGAGAVAGRFRPRPVPMPEAPTGPPPNQALIQDPLTGVWSAPGAPGPPAPTPAPQLGPGPLPPTRPELPAGKPGLKASTVEPGFTPIKSTYRVFLAEKPAGPAGPGAKGLKPEFRQFKDVEAFSQGDAVQQVQDHLGGQRATRFDYRAQEMSKTAEPQPKAEVRRLATGRASGPPLGPREKFVSRAFEATGQGPKKLTKIPKERKPIELPATAAELTEPKPASAEAPTGPPITPSRGKGAEAPPARAPSAAEAVAAAKPKPRAKAAAERPSYMDPAVLDRLHAELKRGGVGLGLERLKAINTEVGGAPAMQDATNPGTLFRANVESIRFRRGQLKGEAGAQHLFKNMGRAAQAQGKEVTVYRGGKGVTPKGEKIGKPSVVVREPTAEEAATMQPGETIAPKPGELVHRLSVEKERRVASRRGMGGGATSFGEERGAEAPPEQRVTPGRRAEDIAAFTEGVKQAATDLKYVDRWTLSKARDWWAANRRAELPTTKIHELRKIIRNELESIAKHGAAIVESEKTRAPVAEQPRVSAPHTAREAAPAPIERASRRQEKVTASELDRRAAMIQNSHSDSQLRRGVGMRTRRIDKPLTRKERNDLARRIAVKQLAVEGITAKATAEPERFSVEVPGLGVKMKTGEPAPKAPAPAEGAAPPRAAPAPPATKAPTSSRRLSPIATGREGSVETPTERFPVRYEEVPLRQVQPSHQPVTFELNPKYPFEQQRDYRTNKIEQLKVIEMARSFNPDYLLADTPTSTDGPPIVSQEGNVLGGNARTMALLRGLEQGTIDPRTLQAAVQRAGDKFGIGDAGKKPGTIIVRRLTADMPIEQQARATKALNEDFKMAVDPISDAVARAQNISGDTVDWIAGVLNDAGPDATVRSTILDDPARLTQLMKRLAEDQVVTFPELPRLLDPSTNKLTPEGQRMIEASLVGRVVKNPKMVREMSPALKNQVLGGLSELTRGEGFPAEWRVNNDVVNGLWLYHQAEKAHKSIDMMLQPQLISDPFLDAVRDNKVAVALAHWFDANRGKSTALRTALQKFNRYGSEGASGQESLGFMGPGKLPHEALNEAFDLKLSPDDYGTGDGTVYLYSGLPLKALEPLWDRVGQLARQLKDWVLIPKDVREPYRPGEPFQEWWERGTYPRTADSIRRWMAQTWQNAARYFVSNWDTRRFPYFHEQLDQFKVLAMHRLAEATDRMSAVVHPLVYRQDATGVFKRRPAEEFEAQARQFQLLVALSDMWARSKAGTLTPASAFPGWSNMSQGEVTAALANEVRELMLKSSPAVKQSHRAWIAWMSDLRKEMEARGKLSPEDRLGWAYAPNVMDDRSWQQMWSVATGPTRVKEASRGYVKQFVGHLRKHDPNMVRAGLQHATNVMLDNLLDDFAHSVGQAWDHSAPVWKRIEEIAKRDQRPVEDVAKETPIPEGFEVYRVGGQKHLWNPATINEYVVQKALLNDPNVGLQFHNMWDVREFAGAEGSPGYKSTYVIPKPIADALGQFREARGPLDRLAAQFSRGISAWKAITLGSIWIPYSMRNAIGDVHNILYRLPGRGPMPGLLPMLRYGPRAVGDLIRAAGPKGVKSARFLEAEAVGVRQNTRAVAEMGDLKSHVDLRAFFQARRHPVLRPIQQLLNTASDLLSGLMILDSVREGTARYAAWNYLVDQGFPPKRAERVVSELIADYRNVDRFTGAARRTGLAPFMVWARQMIPGWFRWITGARLGRYFEMPELAARTPATMELARRVARARGVSIDEAYEILGRQAAIPPPNVPRPPLEPPKGTDPGVWKAVHSGRYTTGTLAAMATGIGVPMALLWYWNNVLHADENRRFDQNFRNRSTYIILPWWRTYDGRSPAFAVQSPLDATLSFFGLGDPLTRAKKFAAAADQGPQAFVKAMGNQLAETGASMGATAADLAGPPVDLMRSLAELPAELYKEQQKTEEQRDVGKLLERKFVRLWGDVLPGRAAARTAQRQDLGGLPPYIVDQMSQYPWGSLVYVPLSDAERKRQRAAGRPIRPGLRPGVGPGVYAPSGP